jgi:hypothetical protein
MKRGRIANNSDFPLRLCVSRVFAFNFSSARGAESELTRRRKGDKHKMSLARRLRAETTISQFWVTQNLGLC